MMPAEVVERVRKAIDADFPTRTLLRAHAMKMSTDDQLRIIANAIDVLGDSIGYKQCHALVRGILSERDRRQST